MSKKITTLDDIDVANKKVLLRVDLNVPITNSIDGKGKTITNNERIIRVIPTIKELISKNAKVILCAHLGRPKGIGFESEFTLKPVAKELEKHLGSPVKFCTDTVGDIAQNAVESLNFGEVLLLENVRFYKEEKENNPTFAKSLADLAEVFVSDAFSASHRAHASTVGVANYLPSAAGRLMQSEIEALEKALGTPTPPIVAIVGGAKISTKLDVFHNLLKKVNTIIIGGGMANTFLNAVGVNIQKSLCEHDMKEDCLKIISEAKKHNCELSLPVDAQIALSLNKDAQTSIHSNREIPENYEIFDCGPKSVENFKQIIDKSKTVIWNGPLGVFEVPPYDTGTVDLAKHVASLTKQGKLVSIAGGGDTVSALEKANAIQDFTYISTAGGAFLEWMEGKELPGVEILKKQ